MNETIETPKRRYVAEISFYVWAQTEKDARKQAEKVARKMRKKEDNGASVEDVYANEFGKLKIEDACPWCGKKKQDFPKFNWNEKKSVK